MRRRRTGTLRATLGTAVVLSALSGLGALGACSASPSPAGFTSAESGGDAGVPTLGDAWSSASTYDQNVPSSDADVPTSCPAGSALPLEASVDCVIDTTESCPSCASWGFACPTWAAPQLQDAQVASAAAFCRANETDAGGALICCTRPSCILSAASGGCDASSATRYECTGSAVPNGACSWVGPSSPNDYCCE